MHFRAGADTKSAIKRAAVLPIVRVSDVIKLIASYPAARAARYAAKNVHEFAFVIGGDKTGDDRFYQRLIPIADALYDTYIEEIRNEGLIP
jgi:hypothetical protein